MKSKDDSKKEKVAMRKEVPYFIVPAEAPRFIQMVGLETTILTGLNGEKMMMVLNDTLPGHTVPLHSHPHEQVGIVYDGKAKLRIGDEERIVQKGDFYRIPANVPHGDTCMSDVPFVMLDIFYPVREDFIEKLKLSSNIQSEKQV
jgi:quercetin dioxygenase-like cupin family protein